MAARAGFRTGREPIVLLACCVVALAISAIDPVDRTTWWLEVFPILLAVPLLFATARRFPLTPLAYRLVFLHALVLIVGAHYTYARVPMGAWVQEWLSLSRNHYDRFAHFVQGFAPAILVREVLLRTSPLRRGGWLFFLVLCVCLSISAAYELVEWAAASIGGESAEAFLGTQGDPWDTQCDMLLALLGSAASQLLLAAGHDRQLGAASLTPPLDLI